MKNKVFLLEKEVKTKNISFVFDITDGNLYAIITSKNKEIINKIVSFDDANDVYQKITGTDKKAFRKTFINYLVSLKNAYSVFVDNFDTLSSKMSLDDIKHKFLTMQMNLFKRFYSTQEENQMFKEYKENDMIKNFKEVVMSNLDELYASKAKEKKPVEKPKIKLSPEEMTLRYKFIKERFNITDIREFAKYQKLLSSVKEEKLLNSIILNGFTVDDIHLFRFGSKTEDKELKKLQTYLRDFFDKLVIIRGDSIDDYHIFKINTLNAPIKNDKNQIDKLLKVLRKNGYKPAIFKSIIAFVDKFTLEHVQFKGKNPLAPMTEWEMQQKKPVSSEKIKFNVWDVKDQYGTPVTFIGLPYPTFLQVRDTLPFPIEKSIKEMLDKHFGVGNARWGKMYKVNKGYPGIIVKGKKPDDAAIEGFLKDLLSNQT